MVTELILWCFSDFTLFGGFLEVWKGNDYEVNSDFSVILVFCKIDKGEVGVGGGGLFKTNFVFHQWQFWHRQGEFLGVCGNTDLWMNFFC